LLAVLATALPAHASTSVDRVRQRIRSEQNDPLLAMLQSADDQRSSIESQIARIENKINEIQTELNQLQPQLEAAKLQREQAAQAVTAAAQAYDLAKRNLSVNALELYASGGWENVLALMSSGDVANYASARVYLDTVVDSGARVVDGFHDAAGRLTAQKKLVDQETSAIIAKTQQLQSEQNRLIQLSEAEQRESNDLTAAMAARAQALAAIEHDPNGFDVVVKSYGSATSDIRMLVAAAQAGQPVEQAQPGTVWWPATGPVTSPFGWRIHPIFHYRSFHTGIDIGAPYGAPIRAAQPGTVVDVVYLGAFGMVTVIDHGFSLATMYAHQSAVLVHPGQHVQAGQIIGNIGCTGWCTGPHLHFEVWSQSNPQNPLKWL
jgi:murein DD-endopeptidase MepM/ murein hydrolase activator NlpD